MQRRTPAFVFAVALAVAVALGRAGLQSHVKGPPRNDHSSQSEAHREKDDLVYSIFRKQQPFAAHLAKIC